MKRGDRQIMIAALVVAAVALLLFWLAGTSDDAAPTAVSPSVADSDGRTVGRTHAYSITDGETVGRTHAYSITDGETVGRAAPARFPFDPNTADSSQLLLLGLKPWQVRNIYKYRAHGGVYRKKEDFARLYGLTVKQYRELEPYIRISRDYQPASTLVAEREPNERDTLRYPIKIGEGEQVVLNTADTTQLRKVPGIGSYYAKEIVRHGQWLGGYVSVDQLDEIDNFPKEAKKYFTIQNAHPQKLNINKLTLQQLRRHPYINYYQAKAIADYRRLHGDIRSLDDLRFSKDFPADAIERLRPYVMF